MWDSGKCGGLDEHHARNRQCGQKVTPSTAVDATSFKTAVEHKQRKICVFYHFWVLLRMFFNAMESAAVISTFVLSANYFFFFFSKEKKLSTYLIFSFLIFISLHAGTSHVESQDKSVRSLVQSQRGFSRNKVMLEPSAAFCKEMTGTLLS